MSNQERTRTLKNIESEHQERSRDEIKKKITVLQTNEKAYGNPHLQLKSHQRDKPVSRSPCKILGNILKTNNGGTQTNRPVKTFDNNAQGHKS